MNLNVDINESNILVVDDKYENLRYLTTLLRNKGYHVRPVPNGKLALSGAQAILPDLILLDIKMPGMDGYEVCRKLKSIPETKEIPVIFLTAANDAEDVVKGLGIGAVDYVTKPFNREILLARIKTHLALKEKTRLLKEMSTKDGLTGIANRRYFDDFLESEWKRGSRANVPISLIMADIDYFKLYNDHYGHQKGDETLRKVANTISDCCNRVSDLTARYGGEEFAVVLGNTTIDVAKSMAEKICMEIEKLNIPHSISEVADVVTASLGVSTMIPDNKNVSDILVNQADQLLYKAKETGRNGVCHGSD